MDLFEGNPDDQIMIDPAKSYYEELVGPGKKFADNEVLSRSKIESDHYIKILERRLDQRDADYKQLETNYNSRAKLEELMDQLKQPLTSNDSPIVKEDVKPGIDQKQIEDLVYSKIQQHETTKKQQENYNLAMTKLRERYGDNYQNILKQQTENLGLTKEFVNDLAKNHPTVLFRTLGVDQDNQRENFQAPVRSSQRSDNFTPTTEKRTWSYWEKIRKENPRLYADPKTATQMQRDYIDLGEAFEDGDFKSI